MLWRPRIRVAEDARRVIRSVATDRLDHLETGGALFGYDPGNGEAVRVVAATGPGPEAIHEPRRFERDLDYTHQRALELYERTGAEWIGEWHTHPAGGLKPSAVDLATYLAHLADPTLGFDCFVAIIVVPRRLACRAAVWEITQRHAVARRLRL